MPEPQPFDVAIIGAGPAGLGAALYTARAQLKTLVLGFPFKSAIAKAAKVANYLSYPDMVGGKEFQERSLTHCKKYGVVHLEEEAINLQPQEGGGFLIETDQKHSFACKAVIIACGKSYKLAGIKDEQRLTGKGVHYCVTCDGFFFKDKKVCVVGHANYAAQEALELLPYTQNLTIFSNGRPWEISPKLLAEVKARKIPLRSEKVLAFEGETSLVNLLLENNAREKFDGAFVAFGTTGATAFAFKLGLEMQGTNIKVDAKQQTNVPGVFAAGDCTGADAQAVKSAGDGCTAALSVIKFIRGKQAYIDYKEE